MPRAVNESWPSPVTTQLPGFAELRGALSAFATGVVVVTAAYEGGEHGMTANSFTSVSLRPPLVLVCIDNDARMSRVLERGMDFGLSVLAAGQESISRHFAGRPQADTAIDFAWRRGVPLVSGALAHFVCRVTDSHVTGDHTVQIAEVQYCERFRKAPLVFFGGSYAGLHAGAGGECRPP